MTAAEAAHVAADEEAALTLFRRAESSGRRELQRRDAKWGQLMCMTELELGEATAVLDDLTAGVPAGDPREIIRAAGRRLGLELKLGTIVSLSSARERDQVTAHVPDPLVRASFRCVYAVALNLAAQYDLALEIAEQMIADAVDHRLEFVLPYGYTAAAGALAGARRYEEADLMLRSAVDESERIHNSHAALNAHALRLRVLAQQGRNEEACALRLPGDLAGLRSLQGELRASEALALVSQGRLTDAATTLDTVRGTTGAIETRVLTRAVDAIAAIRIGRKDVRTTTEALVDETVASGGFDLLVTSYRASPELLATLATLPTTRDRVRDVMGRAGDQELIEAAGFRLAPVTDRLAVLSRREREIHQLVCEGLSNRQVAECLFISEATVKVHVQHIFDKLGVRSRRALAVSAAREAGTYAAPATTAGNTDSGSGTGAPD
jgi:DNA-binding NarL/FixJ family response regulator